MINCCDPGTITQPKIHMLNTNLTTNYNVLEEWCPSADHWLSNDPTVSNSNAKIFGLTVFRKFSDAQR